MNVLMVGVSEKRVGGMNTVAQIYKHSSTYKKKVKMKYVATSTNGSAIARLACMIAGYIKILICLRHEHIDIVHIHMAEKGSAFRKGRVAKMGRKNNKRVIIHLHAGPFMTWYSALNQKQKNKIGSYLSCADKIIVLGDYWKKELSKIIDADKIAVVYNGIPCQKKNRYNKESRDISFFGVMKREKGIYDLINAIEMIDKELSDDIVIRLYGNDLEGDISRIIKEKKLNNRIIMMGWIAENEKDVALSKTMINVLPSYYEGLSMAVIEGISYGLPTITTNISTMPEILGKYKYMIHPGDVEGLANLIKQLANDEKERLRVSACLYRRASRYFADELFINNTIDIYEEILGESCL